ncbi:Phospholipase B-like 1 [Labeo rohita]|uniref:Phospholipase B-like n=1 Tax=Labeo rohita TaxID=84645 RepID=A0ABQ8MWY4_LABRO|nr:Phospholipase B-like 1 [Labeo rohita]
MLKATAYWDSTHKAVLLKEGVLDPQGDAYGYYNDTLSLTGWGVLEIRAGYGQTAEPDGVTMFLAGYLEGFLTAPQIFDHYTNMYPQLINNPKTLVAVKRFMSKQDDWSRQQVKRNTTDPLWIHTGLILAQLDGLQAGVTDWAKKHGRTPLSQFAIQFLNAVGDLLDLIPALVPSKTSGFNKYKAPPMGHCSALIKMLPGFENLLFAHSSWYTGLMMTQTTNNVFNTSLYSYISPASLFSWQRVRLAHTLAYTGEQWAKTFSRYNSGTYNNQYMVVDVSKVNLGSSLEDGALTVVEQIPGLVEYSDQTQTLRRGYWPSYNVPFHRKIYDLSGYEQMWKKYGEDFSYDLCPRAKIFRRDQSSNDPYSHGDPCNSICCRNDLQVYQASPGGCYDTKVTDLHMAQDFTAEALNGPTTEGGLPVFSWELFNSTSHQGLPPKYNFSFVMMQPQLFRP